MRCETSFFSLTLFKKHLTRFWPMWAAWLAGWTLALPVTLWNEAGQRRGDVHYMAETLDDALPPASVFIAIAAAIVAVAVYFYLFKAPAANFIGALPLRREGIFATSFCAGYAMLTAPLVVVSVVTFLVEWALGAVAAGPLLTLLGGCMLLSFFWFSFATLCCAISGSAVASVCFYVIFNGIVVGMLFLVQNVLSAFLYGFSDFSDRVMMAVGWLTPIIQTQIDYNNLVEMGVSRMEMLWAYAAVGFLMLLAALGLHHIRKAERAGDLIAFVPIRWIFRISVTLCGGLAFGMMLMALIFDGRSLENQGATLAGCCAVAAAVSWFVAEMLLQKSFKVFRAHWKGAAVGAVCFVLSICAIDMDWIGFTTRVPAPEQVRSATAYFSGGGRAIDPVAGDGLIYDSQSVSALTALHRYLTENQPTESGEGDLWCRLEVRYDLGLTRLRREYRFAFSSGSELAELVDAAQVAGLIPMDVTAPAPVDGQVGRVNPDTSDWTELTPAQAEAAWKAIVEDYQAGRFRIDPQAYDEERVYVRLYWMQQDEEGYGKTTNTQLFRAGTGTTSLNRVLEEILAQMEEEEQPELKEQAELEEPAASADLLPPAETPPPLDTETAPA